MTLLYALLAAVAALIAAAYKWQWPLIPALICLGIVAYVSQDTPEYSPASSYSAEEEPEPLSIKELPQQYEVIQERTLSNGAMLITLQKNYSILGEWSDSGVSTIDRKSACSLYHDPGTGASISLDC